jgi:hypothetical protein
MLPYVIFQRPFSPFVLPFKTHTLCIFVHPSPRLMLHELVIKLKASSLTFNLLCLKILELFKSRHEDLYYFRTLCGENASKVILLVSAPSELH